MTNRDDDEEKKNVRLMWIASGAIVLFIIGLTGLSMLGVIGHPSSTEPTDLSSHSRTVPTTR